MPRKAQILAGALDNQCAIVRSLGVLSDSWSFLLLREALLGRRTFGEFRDTLGIASDVLSARLHTLVEHGILERIPYQTTGQRARDAYELTAAGGELKIVLVAMQQWGEAHIPRGHTGSVLPVAREDHRRVRASLLDANGARIDHEDVEFVRMATPDRIQAGTAYP